MNKNKVSKWIIFRCLPKTIKVTAIKYKLLLLFLLTGVVACTESATKNGTKVVENDQIKLVFATKPVPFLKELVQKQSQINLLPDSADHNLFILEISQPEGKNLTIESGSAKKGSLKVVRNNTGQNIMISFTGLGPAADIKVSINGILDNGEPIVRWSIKVDNPGKLNITTVRFPSVAAVPAIGSPDDDFIVAPAFPGVMIENPLKNWSENYSAAWSFPGLQSAQFFSYQDKTAGVYVASMDTVGYGRSLRITRQGSKKFIITQEYKLPENPETKWESPYDVAMGVTAGTWQQTADIYKKWAVRQWWCAKTLVQRSDIPDWWKKGPCIHTFYVRSNKKGINSYYPELPGHLRTLRTQIDGPVVPRIGSWENHRSWTAGNYFPVFDSAHARDILLQVREDGFKPFVFLSGILYTFKFRGRDSLLIPGSERYSASYVISKTGKPHIDILGSNRLSYCFCPTVPETKNFFRSVLDQLHSMSIDVVQMDQATSGASPACYNINHGHQIGPGPYQSQAFRELFDDMRNYGKSLSSDFIFLNEELHEELIPYLDAFHTREYCENFWFRATPGAKGIPLFTYLYHEFAMAYGGEGTGITKTKDPNLIRDQVVNLVTGKMPVAGNQQSKQIPMDQAHPDQIRVIRNHMRLLKTEALQFLILGRMLHPMEIEVPTITLKMGGKWHPNPVTERAVMTSSWQSPEGLVGHCLANITDVKQQVKLSLDTRNAPGWAKSDIDLYRADKPDKYEQIIKGVSLPQDYLLELQPLEAVFFVIRPAR